MPQDERISQPIFHTKQGHNVVFGNWIVRSIDWEEKNHHSIWVSDLSRTVVIARQVSADREKIVQDELRRASKEDSYLRLIDVCITQL